MILFKASPGSFQFFSSYYAEDRSIVFVIFVFGNFIMSEYNPSVAIAGAGIGGLIAALALLKRGIDVNVYEQSPVLGEIGAGFQVSANGTRVLYHLSLIHI